MIFSKSELIAALVDAFTLATFDNMLQIELERRRDGIVVADGVITLKDIIGTVVLRAAQDRWIRDLVRAAVKTVPGNPQLQSFCENHQEWLKPSTRGGPAYNHYQSIFMRGRKVFLDRKEFRKLLQATGTGQNSRVLSIEGDRCSGKTYSRDFLHHIRDEELDLNGVRHEICYVHLDDCTYEPETLALAMGSKLGLSATSMPPDRGEQAPRRIPELIEWLGAGIRAHPADLWWLVLDGFRLQVHPTTTHDLIRGIIDATDREWGQVRLVLINYSKHLDIDASAYILTEQIKSVGRSDVEEYFRQIFEQSEKHWEEETIQLTVNEVYLQVEAEAARRATDCKTKILSAALTRAANSLLN